LERVIKEWRGVRKVHLYPDRATIDGERVELGRDVYKLVSSLRAYVDIGGFDELHPYVHSEQPLVCRLIEEDGKRKFDCEPTWMRE